MIHRFKKKLQKWQILHRFYQFVFYLLVKRHLYGWTSPLRVLPDFIVIGTVRSGTTSLYENLSKHPCVYASAYDELGFFDSNFELGLYWYRSLFPSVFTKKFIKFTKKYFMTYDVTPFYIYNKIAAERILSLFPNVKIIALFRNPIDRAYSNYHLGVRDGSEPLSFEEAIKEELKMLESEEHLNSDEISKYTRPRSYLAKGFYADQIRIWLEIFPKENLLFLSSEDFSKNPTSVLSEIFHFLGISDFEVKDYISKNVSTYSKMNQETRNFLLDFFKPHNERFFK